MRDGPLPASGPITTPIETAESATSRSGLVTTRLRGRTLLLRGLVVVGVLAPVAVVGAWMYVRHAVDVRLADAIAAADRDLPTWRLDDLMAARAEVPDEDNAALVAAEVVALLPGGWPPTPALDPLQQALDRLPQPSSATRPDAAAVAVIRDALSERADALQLARSLAEYRRGRHELQIAPNPLDTPLPATQAVRDVARLLAIDAAILAGDGELDRALDSCRAILATSRSIGDEPFLISGLVRISIDAVGLAAIRRVLSQGEPTDEALARLQADILTDRAEPFYLAEVWGERAVFDALITRVRNSEIAIGSLSGEAPDAPVPPLSPWGKLMFDNQRAVGLEWCNQLVAIARQPVDRRPPLLDAWAAEILRVKDATFERWGAVLPLLMMPAMEASSQAHARYQAEMGASAILLAAERHRRRHGAWPESVAAIDPAILVDPPVDPFTGRPYRIERRDGQFLVHSVGQNLRDERGAYDPKTFMKGGPDDYGSGAWDVPLRRQPATEAQDSAIGPG